MKPRPAVQPPSAPCERLHLVYKRTILAVSTWPITSSSSLSYLFFYFFFFFLTRNLTTTRGLLHRGNLVKPRTLPRHHGRQPRPVALRLDVPPARPARGHQRPHPEPELDQHPVGGFIGEFGDEDGDDGVGDQRQDGGGRGGEERAERRRWPDGEAAGERGE